MLVGGCDRSNMVRLVFWELLLIMMLMNLGIVGVIVVIWLICLIFGFGYSGWN